MAVDEFNFKPRDVDDPVDNAASVTPNDSTDLTAVTRAIYVGGFGDMAVIMKNGQTVTFTNLESGVVYPYRVSRILSTGTTATGIIALW